MSSQKPAVAQAGAEKKENSPYLMLFCFLGLQASYLTWGYVQEKVMTKEYTTGKFPSATFCVFSNRVLAILAAAIAITVKHGQFRIPAPMTSFAPCAVSNTLSSYGQYQALRYVSFPLQTLSKSTKVIPVMLMGKFLNKKEYPLQEYGEAALISAGVSMFTFAETNKKESQATEALGLVCLTLYIVSDSFTSQWQSRVYKAHPDVDQYQMMFSVNMWSIVFTFAMLLASGELGLTLQFLSNNPEAIIDNITISVTSATGQLFIYYTVKEFGPVVFTIIMTTRQMFSMVLSSFAYGHEMGGALAYVGVTVVFGTLWYRVRRRYTRS